MENRIQTKALHDHIGEEVTLAGWVDARRDHGKIIFIDLRDGSGIVQTVILGEHKGAVEEAEKVRDEWVLKVEGKVNKRPDNMVNKEEENGDIEIEVLELTVISNAEEIPFEKDASVNLDTLLDKRPFTLRSKKNRSIFKVQNEIIQAYRDFLLPQDFVEFEAPKIVGDDAEGGGNVFKIDYMNERSAYLATSPQLYKQIMVGVFERVFSIGDVFRAEKHATSRHLNEYTSLDVEYGFIEDHHDIMKLEMELMRFLLKRLKEKVGEEFRLLGATLPLVPDGDFPILKLREAQALISKETGEDCTKEPDLEPSHERLLCEYARKELHSDFIFVTHYPTEKRPFYTFDDPDDPGFTKSFDLLFRGVEITTGGQRVHEASVMKEKIKDKELDPASFSFYLQAFEYGMPPHGGWGMGLERLTQKFLELDNVKEAALFPRSINRIDSLLSE